MEKMVNQFSAVPTVDIPRNVFIRNHTWKGTLDSGYLIPVFFDEVLPGDTKKLTSTFFGRLTTPFVPVLDNIWLDYHIFFVPNRLIWDKWKRFMGERINPTDSIDFTIPQVTTPNGSGFGYESLFDYLSIPPNIQNLSVSALYPRAYNLIWNEWYRDENLQNSVTVNLGDGPDSSSDYTLLKRGKRQDYFTSALPQPQKGAGASLPLGTTAPVRFDMNVSGQLRMVNQSDNYSDAWFGLPRIANAGNGITIVSSGATKYPDGDVPSGLYTDLTSATSATINTLRQAIALQQFLETDMRAGTRYVELLLSHFGVRCPDYRLQRPEYLGGSTSRVTISPIAQTSSTDTTSPQGNLAALGTISTTGSGFTSSFTEHGVILGLVSIRCDLNYQQGIDRHFLRKTRYDYFFPTLAHLGEQGIYNKEIYTQGSSVVDTDGNIIDDKIFGYQERYGEYRYKNNYITGKFRSSYSNSLDVWHLAQNFANLPTLNNTFIEENPPISRILAVQNEPQFLLDVYHEFTDIRPIPQYGIPGLRRI